MCKGSRFFYNFSLRFVFFSFLVKMETQTKFVRPEKKKAVARAHSVQQSRGHSLSRAHSLTGEKQRRPMAHTQQQQQSRAELLLSFVSFRSKKKKILPPHLPACTAGGGGTWRRRRRRRNFMIITDPKPQSF